jgi:integrase
MPKLNKRVVDAARPKQSDYIIFDKELPGFGLRVLPSGKKSYLVQYRAAGRTRRYTFGRHGPMTPEEARREATSLLAEIRRGGNPSETRRQGQSALNIAELGERFLREHVASQCKASTAKEYERSIKLFINPALGRRKIWEVSSNDIARLHHDMRDIPYQANRTLGVLSKMFNLAEAWGLRADSSNPCRHVKKYREEKRERFLTLEQMVELGSVLKEIEREGSESSSAIAAIRLLLLTGCRLSEVLTLRWEYVQDGFFELPDSKTGRKRVYFGDAVKRVLSRLEREENNPFVIPGKKPGSHLMDLQKPWQRVRKSAALENLRIHDLRHSFASAALSEGESLTMIGKLLGHTDIQSTQRYSHLAQDSVQEAANRVSTKISDAIS